jgi:glucose/arabinose dehydrogenase
VPRSLAFGDVRRVALLLALLAALAGCGGDGDEGEQDPAPRPQPEEVEQTPPDGGSDLARSTGRPRLKTIATGLEAPWEIAFLPDGRALVTERPGRVRLLERNRTLRDEPIAEIDVAAIGEGGLHGVAVDPSFERNGFVYLYRTTDQGNQVVRYLLRDDALEDETVLVDGIAAAAIHDGGRIHFGPDRRLYFSTGDAGQDELAQDSGSLNGKILRLTPRQYRGAGGRPEVFSLGHRNPQGFDWGADGSLVADEHGPDGDDEVNVLRKGGNYGWPLVRGEDHGDFEAPATVYPDSIAPSGGSFVSLPGSEWTGDYLFGCLVGEQIRRVRLDDSDGASIDEPLFEGQLGRVRTVVEGPDGALYALTSNRDGRGNPSEQDDRIVRIVPPASGS